MAPNAKRVETDRVKRIQIRPYDQVFALTQYIINSGLETNWKRMCDQTPTLANGFGASQPGAGTLSGAKLDYPRVVVEADFAEAMSGCLYMMCFKAGKFLLKTSVLDENGEPKFDDEGEPMENKTEFNLAGWKIAFAMQLGMTVEERVSDEFKRTVLKAGEYSLNQLQAKFETAIFKPERSVYGDKTWNQFPQNIKDGLEFVFKKLQANLLQRMKGAEKLGSVLKSTKDQGTSAAMTFEPSEIQYQTYPWIDPQSMGGFKPSSGLEGNQRLNYMLYCETTNGRKLPPVDQRSLPRLGNWTDGRLAAEANSENTEFGSFHMSRENFFDGYLLRKLRFLNRAMEPYGTWHNVRLENIAKIIPHWDSDLSIGKRKDKSENDSFYDWKKESDTKWYFESSVTLPRTEDRAGHNGWSGEAWADSKASCRNVVEFVPGGDLIKVSGKSHFEYIYEFTDKHIIGKNDVSRKELEFDIKWDLTLDLEAVDDGGLQILATFTEPSFSYTRSDLVDQFATAVKLKDDISIAVKNTKQLKTALAQDLANKQGLVLPAAGVFFFKNPILSWRGDLICSVAYSTVQPEKMMDPMDNTKVNEDGVKRATF